MKRKLWHYLLLFSVTVTGLSSCSDEADTKVADSPKGIATANHTATDDEPVIVIIGASTAAGRGASTPDSAWVNRLIAATVNNTKPLHYRNLALGGLTSYAAMPTGFVPPSGRPAPDTARNVTKALSYHPDLVMITYPSNDVANNYANSEVLSNYRTVIKLLEQASVNYIVFGAQPRDLSTLSKRKLLKTLSDSIASAFPDHHHDYYDMLATSTYNIKPELAAGDGIHVNDTGHRLIFKSVLNHPIFIGTID